MIYIAFLFHMASHGFTAFAGAYGYKRYIQPFIDSRKELIHSLFAFIGRERVEAETVRERLSRFTNPIRASDGRFISAKAQRP